MSKEVKRYEAMLLEDNPRLQNLLPQGAILCGKKPVEVYLASDYDALLAERDALKKALEQIAVADWQSSESATDNEISMAKGALIRKLKRIADAALQGAQP